MHQGGTLEHYC